MQHLTASMIQANIDAVQQQITAACEGVGRDPTTVKLVAVSKKRTVTEIEAALACGIVHLGENRVQEALDKQPSVSPAAPHLTWHMIGHVQSRKARDVAAHFDVVHSVDSDKLLRRLEGFCAEVGRQLDVLVQVNVSGEDSKYGLAMADWENSSTQREQLWALAQQAIRYEHIRLVGLMTMAPFVDDSEAVRPYFASLRRLQTALRNDISNAAWQELSMGMTNDYQVAIEEGATLVRVGRAIFGERNA